MYLYYNSQQKQKYITHNLATKIHMDGQVLSNDVYYEILIKGNEGQEKHQTG